MAKRQSETREAKQGSNVRLPIRKRKKESKKKKKKRERTEAGRKQKQIRDRVSALVGCNNIAKRRRATTKQNKKQNKTKAKKDRKKGRKRKRKIERVILLKRAWWPLKTSDRLCMRSE